MMTAASQAQRLAPMLPIDVAHRTTAHIASLVETGEPPETMISRAHLPHADMCHATFRSAPCQRQ